MEKQREDERRRQQQQTPTEPVCEKGQEWWRIPTDTWATTEQQKEVRV